jgi:hypothetical protein
VAAAEDEGREGATWERRRGKCFGNLGEKMKNLKS